MPVCIYHQTEMQLWTPQRGAPRYTCRSFVGIGEPNTNPKGYCNYQVAAAAAVAPVAAPAPQARPIALPSVSDIGLASPRLQAAIAALEAASRLGGTTLDVMERTKTFYHRLLKPCFMSDMPQPLGEERFES